MIIKCNECNKLVQHTKGITDAEKITSLLTNFGNHIGRKHPHIKEADAEVAMKLVNDINFILLVDNLVTIDTTDEGKITKERLDATVQEVVDEVCRLLGIDEEEEYDDMPIEGEVEVQDPEEGVIELAIEPVTEVIVLKPNEAINEAKRERATIIDITAERG